MQQCTTSIQPVLNKVKQLMHRYLLPFLISNKVSVKRRTPLSTFLGEAPHAIKRGVLEAQVLPTELSAGIPIQLLSNRPDVKAA